MFWDLKKSIERRRIISVRKSKTGFADAYVKFSLGGFDGGKGKYFAKFKDRHFSVADVSDESICE